MKVCCIYIFCHKKKSLAKNTDYSFTIRGEKKVRLRHKKHVESRVRGNLKPVVLDASLHVPNIVSLLCSCELGYGPLNTRLSPNTEVLTSRTCGACCVQLIDHSRPGKVRLYWFVLLFQGLANFYCKGSDNKYFRLCEPYSLCHNDLTLPLQATVDNR